MILFELKHLNSIISYKKSENISDEEFILNFLSVNKSEILSKINRFSKEDLWLSEYYWLLWAIRQKGMLSDAGAKQQVFQLIVEMSNNIDMNDVMCRKLVEIETIFDCHD